MNDTTLLDRLVDGELSDAERCDLLTQLESEPGGWRRCALAFLEAQEWQTASRSVAHETANLPKPTVTLTAAEPIPRRNWSVTALAASVALALIVGFAGGDRWRSAQLNADQDRTDNIEASSNVVDTSPSDNSGHSQSANAVKSVGWDGPRMRVGFLTVANESDGTLRHVPVNVVEGPGVDESWLSHVPPAISARYVQLLHKQGYDVQQEREIVPFDVDEGQQVVLPVDRVRIVPVREVAY